MANPLEKATLQRTTLTKRLIVELKDESKEKIVKMFCLWLSISELKSILEEIAIHEGRDSVDNRRP